MAFFPVRNVWKDRWEVQYRRFLSKLMWSLPQNESYASFAASERSKDRGRSHLQPTEMKFIHVRMMWLLIHSSATHEIRRGDLGSRHHEASEVQSQNSIPWCREQQLNSNPTFVTVITFSNRHGFIPDIFTHLISNTDQFGLTVPPQSLVEPSLEDEVAFCLPNSQKSCPSAAKVMHVSLVHLQDFSYNPFILMLHRLASSTSYEHRAAINRRLCPSPTEKSQVLYTKHSMCSINESFYWLHC